MTSGEIQSRQPLVGRGRGVGPPFEEKLDHIRVAFLGGHHQGGGAMGRLSVDGGAFVQEQPDNRDMAFLRRHKQGRRAVARSSGVNVSPAICEKPGDIRMAFLRRHEEGRDAVAPPVIGVGAATEEELDHIRVAFLGRPLKCAGAILVFGLDVGALVQ